MALKLKSKKIRRISAVLRSREDIIQSLNRTSGLWREKKIDPLAYQRKVRKEY